MDAQFGDAGEKVVSWLTEKGYLRKDDCVMNVACDEGAFAEHIANHVRILVCMDTNPAALEEAGRRCAKGCRTELFPENWNEYVPRGGYDTCVMSPSHLCFDTDGVLKMESVASRSCAVIFPLIYDFRRFRKGILQSSGVPSDIQDFPDSRSVELFLKENGRKCEQADFSCTIVCEPEVLKKAFVNSCADKGIREEVLTSLAGKFAESISRDGKSSYRFKARVTAWNLPRRTVPLNSAPTLTRRRPNIPPPRSMQNQHPFARTR